MEAESGAASTVSSVVGNRTRSDSRYYEPTLMYGKYRRDLGAFARQEAERVRLQRLNEQSFAGAKVRSKFGKCGQRVAKFLSRSTFYRKIHEYLLLIIVALIMAVLSFFIDWFVEVSLKGRRELYMISSHNALKYFVWVAIPCVIVVGVTYVGYWISPQAIGSGIPEMKTILRGVVLKEYLSLKTFFAKVTGLSLMLITGLPIGKEGPFVHIASIVARQVERFAVWASYGRIRESKHETLAAACAIGVASAFGSPIGGVLFSIEVTSTYFAVRNYWRGFFSACVAATSFRLLAVMFGHEYTLKALFKTNFPRNNPFDAFEILVFAATGIICGVYGAAFVWFHEKLVSSQRSWKAYYETLKKYIFIYPLMVTLIITSVTFPEGFGQFMSGTVSYKQIVGTLFANESWFANPITNTTSTSLSDVPEAWQNADLSTFLILLIFIAMKFWMTALAITLPVPAGVFIPIFIQGACIGRMVGEAMALIFPDGLSTRGVTFQIIPGAYALVGAAALSGCTTHTVSTAVIVAELTGQIYYLIPTMIAVIAANAVGQQLGPSIYDSIIMIKRLPYLPSLRKSPQVQAMKVEDFMETNVKAIAMNASYGDVKEVVEALPRALVFPVVDTIDDMTLVGSVSRVALQRELNERFGFRNYLAYLDALDDENDDDGDDDYNGYSGLGLLNRPMSPGASEVSDENSFQKEKDKLVAFHEALNEKLDEKNLKKPNGSQNVESNSESDQDKIDVDDNSKTELIDLIVTPPKDDGKKEKKLRFEVTPVDDLIDSKSSLKLDEAEPSRFKISPVAESSDDKKPSLDPTTEKRESFKINYNTVARFDVNRYQNRKLSQIFDDKERSITALQYPNIAQQMEETRNNWRLDVEKEKFDFSCVKIQQSPFQVVVKTSLFKLHSMISLLGEQRAYVTKMGRLVGVVSLGDIRRALETIKTDYKTVRALRKKFNKEELMDEQYDADV